MVPDVAVVVSTYQRPERLRRLLQALEVQDMARDRFEVVVVDDASGPPDSARLREVAAGSPLAVTLVEQPVNGGPAKGRNAGWRRASAPVVAFTDDDCQPGPGWLREGLAALAPGTVAVGRVLPHPDQAADGPWSRSLTVKDTRWFQTANAFYCRADLEEVGGFDEAFRFGGEDTDLGLRVTALGREAVFAEKALVHHDVRLGSARDLARENLRKWVDLPLVVKKHPIVRRRAYRRYFWKRTHPPTLLLVGGVVLLPLSPWALLLALPYAGVRLVVEPWSRSWPARLTRLPGGLLVDLSEVVAVCRGSLRHRTVLL